ncbi:MAG: Hexose phosphate uptake regulatory protein UhpC [Labilithrix sp.]|nr:Hexose phosphate uptake regulatory protein UhpC [Labilithrix sp.]
MRGADAGDEAAPPRRVLPLLLVGYAAFYLCRANVEPALNLLAIEHGYDNEQIGVVMAVALGAYAVGKLVLGPLADLWGGKRILVASLVGTALVSLAIGASDAPRRFGPALGLVVIGVLVVANRFVQAGGWGGLVDVVGATYGAARRGTIMGILSTSYDVGNVLALVLSAGIVHAGASWRALFVVNPLIVLCVALVVRVALPGSRLRTESAPPTTTTAGDSATPRSEGGLGAIALRLAQQRAFWFATGLSFLLTFVRAGFMTWTPRFLYEVSVAANVPSATSSSIAKSAFFGVAGIVGSVVTGRISDRLGPGRRAPVMTTSLALLFACTLALAHAGVHSPLVATAGVAACGLFLLGPYSLLAGAVSLDVASTDGRGAASAAGFIDAVGYVGASLSAFVLGSVSKRAGWTAAFDVVAGVTALALLLALAWSAGRASPRRESATST